MALNLRDQGSSAGDHGGAADAGLENFAAELTEAAYPVALRHGLGEKWLEVQLQLWQVLTQTVKNWDKGDLLPLLSK